MGKNSNRRWNTKRERKKRWIKIVLIILLVIFALFLALVFVSQIKTIEIEGNDYYSDEDIKKLIINDPLEQNALYLYWEYNYWSVDEIPFIDTIEVDLKGIGDVKITIYEKGIVGMVEYLDTYMYFDKDGILVESSKEKMEGIPQITGLLFDNLVLGEQLPVKDSDVFDSILTLTQMLKKNEIWPDKINFDKNMEITLAFEEAKVLLGNDKNLDEKVMRLKHLMPDLLGRKGILHMENFNEDTKNITFENIP